MVTRRKANAIVADKEVKPKSNNEVNNEAKETSKVNSQANKTGKEADKDPNKEARNARRRAQAKIKREKAKADAQEAMDLEKAKKNIGSEGMEAVETLWELVMQDRVLASSSQRTETGSPYSNGSDKSQPPSSSSTLSSSADAWMPYRASQPGSREGCV